jgi:hypothetical protein
MKEENWFCECNKAIKSYAVLSDAGSYEVCCSCKKIIKKSLSLYDGLFRMDENELAREVYLSNIGNDIRLDTYI